MAVKVQGTTVIDGSQNLVNANNLTASGKINLSSGSGYLGIPSGTTSERPTSPVTGEVRFNTDDNLLEQYDGSEWELTGSGLEVLSSLDQSIPSGESVTLSLSGEAANLPLVSVTKEVPQIDVTNNDWVVTADGSNFELHDTAYDTTLKPSNTTVNGTFILGSGSFTEEDVGKRIVGNGGEAILTGTDGSYFLETEFNDISTIASGDWSMFALGVYSDDVGLTLSGITSLIYPKDQYTTAITASASIDTEFWNDINSMTGDAKALIFDSTVNIHDMFSDNSIVATYNFDGDANDLGGNYNGTWVGTEDYIGGQFGQAANFNGVDSYIQVNSSFGSVFDYNNRYTLSFWLINTNEINLNFGNSQGNTGLSASSSFNRIYIAKPDDGSGNRYLYDFPDGFEVGDHAVIVKTGDETLDFYKNGSFMATWSPTFNGVGNNGDNTIGLGIGYYTDGAYDQFRIFNRALSSSEINQLYLESAGIIETDKASSDELYYAVSADDRTTWKVINDTEGTERSIVRNISGTWEYNSNTTYGSETWVASSTNDEFSAINESMTVAANRMNSDQLNNISDTNHFQLGDDLDLSITFYAADGENRVPTSNGVTINYDANTKNSGAAINTDYEYSFNNSNNTLQFTALSTENFKIRVV